MQGYSKNEGIKIVPYNPEWKKIAKEEIEFLHSVLGDELLIEHIGSTAIEGCSAKEIIDIQILADDQTEVERIRAILTPLYQGVSSADSQAKGFLCFDKEIKGNDTIRRTHHIHVEQNLEKWHQRILFRNYLINHPAQMIKYEQIKQNAALLSPNDMTAYSRLKDDFINEIIQRAKK